MHQHLRVLSLLPALLLLPLAPGVPGSGGHGSGGMGVGSGSGALERFAPGPRGLAAQVPERVMVGDTLQRIRLVDGSTLFARVVAVEGGRVTLETAGGDRVEVAEERIRSVAPARGRVVEGEFWTDDPNRTRLLVLAPTGRTLEPGEGYISSFWGILPFVSYGVADRVTLSAGTPLLPGLVGRVAYLAPKVGVHQRPGMDLAVGSLAFFATEAVGEGSVGLLYGVGTFGTPDHSLSAGAGWGFALGGGEARVSNDPVVLLGGEFRVGRNVKLLTENYVLPGEFGGVFSAGVRLFGERLSVDFGIGTATGITSGWLPVLNFVYNCGGPG
jgi:hypothetical protein